MAASALVRVRPLNLAVGVAALAFAVVWNLLLSWSLPRQGERLRKLRAQLDKGSGGPALRPSAEP
jgi:hypothetical protein